jgi:hypothetical protein
MSLFSNLLKVGGVLGGALIGGPAGAAIAGGAMGAGSGIDKKNAQDRSRKSQTMSQAGNALRGGMIRFQPTEDANIIGDALTGGVTGLALQQAGLFDKLLGPGADTQGLGLGDVDISGAAKQAGQVGTPIEMGGSSFAQQPSAIQKLGIDPNLQFQDPNDFGNFRRMKAGLWGGVK